MLLKTRGKRNEGKTRYCQTKWINLWQDMFHPQLITSLAKTHHPLSHIRQAPDAGQWVTCSTCPGILQLLPWAVPTCASCGGISQCRCQCGYRVPEILQVPHLHTRTHAGLSYLWRCTPRDREEGLHKQGTQTSLTYRFPRMCLYVGKQEKCSGSLRGSIMSGNSSGAQEQESQDLGMPAQHCWRVYSAPSCLYSPTTEQVDIHCTI